VRNIFDSVSRFINNEWVKSVDGRSIKVFNPATGDALCSVSEASEKDVETAVASARAAFEGPWSKETPQNRGRLLNKLCGLLQRDTAKLAAVEALQGMNINLAFGGLEIAISTLQYYAGWADKIEGTTIDTNPDTFTYTRREPVSAPFHSIYLYAKLSSRFGANGAGS
jgi:aldehyde dehydrogenase (NAD+)